MPLRGVRGHSHSPDWKAEYAVYPHARPVTRLSNRLGLTSHPSDAVKIEHDLIPIIPEEDWTIFSHLLIAHGRAICTASA